MNDLLFDRVSIEIAKVSTLSASEIYKKLEHPPDTEMGDVSLPCFTLSRVLKKAPQVIAEELRFRLLTETSPTLFKDIEVVGGYLNFYLNTPKLLKQFYDIASNDLLVNFPEYEGKKILIEHTSVNPNASPHIGRARNALIGDATVRLFRFLGCDVDVHYFVNDIGKQIALLVYCTKEQSDIEFSELLSLYVAANEELKNNPDVEDKVFDLLHRMENGDEDVFSHFSKIVNICVMGQMKIFNEFGIYYDQYDYESQYVQSGKTDEVLSSLHETNRLFKDEEGRLVLNLKEFNINPENPYLPLTRQDKTSLYPLRDICYNIDKVKENAYRNIVVLGEDQRLYGRQINAALNLLDMEGPEIINYSFVLLPDGKMSTRTGQVVLLEDLMRDTVAFAKSTISKHRHSNHKEEDSPDELLPKQLAYGAIKYSILKCSNEKNVIFDRESALNFQGNTSVYIQYSYARIQSMLKAECIDLCREDMIVLNHPLEWEIVKKILLFNPTLEVITNDFNFSSLCNYLFELCQLFSRWYKECPIKNADDSIRGPRLFLASVIAEIIQNGLHILGIDAPERI